MTLNDDSLGAPAGHTFQGATVVSDSAIVVAWLDERPVPTAAPADSEAFDDASVYSVRSEDFGATWGPNRPHFGRVCPCCRVQLAGDAGEVLAAWRKHYPGQVRDVVVASLDGTPARAFSDDWQIAGCPHTGPAIVLAPSGARHLAWFTGSPGRAGIYYRHWTAGLPDSSSAPLAIESGEHLPTSHVSLAAAPSHGAVIAYDVAPDGKRGVTIATVDASGRRIVQKSHVPGSESATYPQVALLGRGTAALVAWSGAAIDGRQRLGMARVKLAWSPGATH